MGSKSAHPDGRLERSRIHLEVRCCDGVAIQAASGAVLSFKFAQFSSPFGYVESAYHIAFCSSICTVFDVKLARVKPSFASHDESNSSAEDGISSNVFSEERSLVVLKRESGICLPRPSCITACRRVFSVRRTDEALLNRWYSPSQVSRILHLLEESRRLSKSLLSTIEKGHSTTHSMLSSWRYHSNKTRPPSCETPEKLILEISSSLQSALPKSDTIRR